MSKDIKAGNELQAPPARQVADHDVMPLELGFLEVITFLGRYKWVICVPALLFAIVGAGYSMWMTPVYLSTTTLIPSKQGGSGGLGVMAALGAVPGGGQLAALTGLDGAIGGGDQFYIAVLRSQTLQDRMIERFKLRERYGSPTQEWARLSLSNQASVAIEKGSGLLRISVLDADRQFAADLANAHVEELNSMLSRLAITEAQQRRLYFEQQVVKAQAKLVELDKQFRQIRQTSGLQLPSVEADVQIQSVAGLRSQIAAREVALGAMSRFATAQNQDVQRLSSEISAMKARLAAIETAGSKVGGDLSPLQMEAMIAYRELKAQEATLEGYVRQLASARIDESREGPVLQVVDVAIPAEMRSKPERRQMTLAFAVAGLVLGFGAALARSYIQWLRSSETRRKGLARLRAAWF